MEYQLFELRYAIDTFYLLICGAFVMWMAAGFSMLEAGLVRTKNTTEILIKNLSLYAMACMIYMACGYHFMYSGGFFLSSLPSLASLDSMGIFEQEDSYAGAADFFFQVVFVATALSIVSGAIAERMKLWAFLLFGLVLAGIIYPIQGSWTWGGNSVFGLYELSYNDYAGSGIVHMAGAAAALAGVLILGPRTGKYTKEGKARAIPGANLPLASLGTLILWMGWFGFNGGSTLKLGSVAAANEVALVFLNTNAAASGGLIAALIIAKLIFGKNDITMILNGALAGLVAITAAPMTPTAFQATLIGAVGGALVVFSIIFMDKLKIDDPVGAISVHGVVGIWGIFAVLLTNSEATFVGQLVGALTIFVWVFVTSIVVWSILKATIGVRISKDEEMIGLDIIECGQEAYPEFTASSSR